MIAVLAIVRALTLPAGFTVAPEAWVRQIAIARDGTVVALATTTDRTNRQRAFAWSAQGERATFTPLPFSSQSFLPSRPQSVAAGSSIYVTAAVYFSGAYSGVSTEVQRWAPSGSAHWKVPGCIDSDENTDQKAYAADDDGRVAVTMDITGQGSYQVDNDPTGKYAPYAFVVRDGVCRNLGRGIVQGVRGEWAAGYRGYLDGHLAADNMDADTQTAYAVRWYGEHAQTLGEGDALAVNASGLAVGADAVPAPFVIFPSPRQQHAIAWNSTGRRTALAPNAKRSVAYDVADDGTVVGMLVDSAGRHYAFRWRNGTLQRLDDLPHPPGWRFESAYAIDGDDTIAGIGTYNGTATVFVWSDRSQLVEGRR